MYKLISILLLFATLIGTSCSTAGHYTSNPRERMTHAGSEFILTKSDSFKIRSWTDAHSIEVDGSGNRIWKENRYRGEGIYQRNGDSLYLTFSNNDSLLVKINFTNDSITKSYDISLFDELGRPFMTQFQVKDSNNVELRSLHFPRKNTYTLSFQKDENPLTLNLSGYGVNIKEPIINLNDLHEGLNEIKLKTYNGYFARGDSLNIWFKKTFTGIRYEFKGRKRWMPKKWGFKLLNKLYRDY